MKLTVKIFAVAAAALCLASCGKLDDLGKKEDSDVSLATLRTTKPIEIDIPDTTEETSSEDDSDVNEVSTVIPDSDPDSSVTGSIKTFSKKKTTTTAKKVTTKLPATTTKKTTTKSQTTKSTTASTSASTTASTTASSKDTASDTQTTPTETSSSATSQTPEEPKELTQFEKDVRVIYNGVEFGLGDKMSEIESSLGNQAAPVSNIYNFQDESDVSYEYSYYGMTIEVKDDKVIQIEIVDNMFYDDTIYVYTKLNISRNSNQYDVQNAYGDAASKTDEYWSYAENGTSAYFYFLEDGMVSRILISSYNN